MNYTLKKDGWHFRLQQWTFGKDMPRFNNFCPFFWLTIFCVIASPFTTIWKLLWKIVDILILPIEYATRPIEWLMDKRKNRYERNINIFVGGATDWKAYQLFKSIHGWSDLYNSYLISKTSIFSYSNHYFDMREGKRILLRDRLKAWQDKNTDWRERILDARKEEIELLKDEKARKSERRAGFLKIVEYTKLLIWLPVGVVINYLVYWSALLVLICLENSEQFWSALLIGAGALAMIITIIGLISLIIHMEWHKTYIAKPFMFIGKVTLFPVGRGIKEVCSFLWMNVKAFKENYCPQITWSE